jgi:nucleoid-associated protein EbfC
MFDQLKMLKQAHDLQKKMEAESISSEYRGVNITMNGKQEIKELTINDEQLLTDKDNLEKVLKDAVNNATRNAQMAMAQKMRGEMGGMFGL